ncbi:MAG: hypothetical protein ACK55V_09355 [Alphaproteobacteria bacterium]
MNNRASSPWPLFPMPSSGQGPFFSEPGTDLGSIAGADPSFFLTPQRPNELGQPEDPFNSAIFAAAQRQIMAEGDRTRLAPRQQAISTKHERSTPMNQEPESQIPLPVRDLMDQVEIYREKTFALFEALASANLNMLSEPSVRSLGQIGVDLSDTLGSEVRNLQGLIAAHYAKNAQG